MNFTNVLNGNGTTHAAQGCALSAVHNQLAFIASREIYRAPERDEPVFDESIASILGVDGVEKTRLDPYPLVKGWAYSLAALHAFIQKPNPTTGKPTEWLTGYCKTPARTLVGAVDYRANSQMLTLRANAEALRRAGRNVPAAEIEAHLAAIKAEVEAVLVERSKPFVTAFASDLKAAVSLLATDPEAVIDVICETLTDAGEDVAKIIKGQATVIIDRQAERVRNRQRVTVDAGIVELAK